MNASPATLHMPTPPADSCLEPDRKPADHGDMKTRDYPRYEAFADGTAAREVVLNDLLGISTPGVRPMRPRTSTLDMSQSFADGSALRQVSMEKALR
ncbi:MAG: hypothetical protein GX898_01265 [Corynebacterium sp.]|uniref:hypothetical protein n=1 Tax=uncultured Corynebacterium sp. TaxID=159447 RepID=UPI0017F5966C|nr:hypothetical protein [uncultured Corynebacterium sp.]NLZ56936.1 hypothetical protein [Corynebacterium sp.]